MSLPFTEFIIKNNLKNQASSNIKKQILKNLGYKTKIYIRNNKLTTKDVIDDPHLTIGKYWTLYNVEKFLDCCSSPSPDLLTKYFIKGNENFFQTRKTKKKKQFLCCFLMLNLFLFQITKMDFKIAVLHLY